MVSKNKFLGKWPPRSNEVLCDTQQMAAVSSNLLRSILETRGLPMARHRPKTISSARNFFAIITILFEGQHDGLKVGKTFKCVVRQLLISNLYSDDLVGATETRYKYLGIATFKATYTSLSITHISMYTRQGLSAMPLATCLCTIYIMAVPCAYLHDDYSVTKQVMMGGKERATS